MKNVLNKIISWFKPSKVELPVSKVLLLEFYNDDKRYGYEQYGKLGISYTENEAIGYSIWTDEQGNETAKEIYRTTLWDESLK